MSLFEPLGSISTFLFQPHHPCPKEGDVYSKVNEHDNFDERGASPCAITFAIAKDEEDAELVEDPAKVKCIEAENCSDGRQPEHCLSRQRYGCHGNKFGARIDHARFSKFNDDAAHGQETRHSVVYIEVDDDCTRGLIDP